MELINKGYLMSNLCVFLFLVAFTLCFIRCSDQKESCYEISKINLALESPGTESVFFEVSDQEVIDKIKGKKTIGDYYESNIKHVSFLKENDTIDQTESLRLKKSQNGIYLIYRTLRFHSYNDSIEVANVVKAEDILLKLKNGEVFRITYCDNGSN